MENTQLSHIIKDAEEYGRYISRNFISSPNKKKYTPVNRIKVPVKDVTESATIAKLVGELASAERILSSIKNEIGIAGFKSIEEYRDFLVGELQIYVMELNNIVARRATNGKTAVTLEEVIAQD